jgi:hypothetical protein
MSLVRWFRKNNKKVMAVVVIVIMFGFIGGGTLLQTISQRSTVTLAYYRDNKKITNNDLMHARRELDILRALQADLLLQNQDLQGILLGELLFKEQRTSPELVNHIKRTIRQQQLRISDRQINRFYRRSVPSSIYWMLLKTEARNAGIFVSNEQAGELLGQILPQLYDGMKYSQIMASLMNQYGLPEQQLLELYSQLLAILQYARIICSNENMTRAQVSQTVAFERESINTELVRFDAGVFTSDTDNLDSAALKNHFDKYKKFVPGEISDKNPCGFGYMLPDRVRLEYIVVKLDDVKPLIEPPTNQEKEDYYTRNRLSPEIGFTEQVLSDPNDPNSAMTERTKSYAEVVDVITKRLIKKKIVAQATRILQQAKSDTEPRQEDIDDMVSHGEMTPEKYKRLAGDYKSAAEKLSEKHDIKLYYGKTGLLSPDDMQKNDYLTRLYVEGYGQTPVSLIQIVFAVGDLTASVLGPFDVPQPVIYENIGPLKDLLGSPWAGTTDIAGHIMALVRVIQTAKAAEPESINQTYSTKAPSLDPNEEDEDSVYSVRKQVAEDLKKLKAMDAAKNKAQEFIDMAAKDGWNQTIDKFNELYADEAADPNAPGQNTPKPFALENRPGLRRISEAQLLTIKAHTAGNPLAESFLKSRMKQKRFVEKLYSLVPEDSNSVPDLPVVIEFKPDLSCYCIKELSVRRISLEDYEKIKASRLQREDYTHSQSLAAVHFSPDNILIRMDFEPAETEEPQVQQPEEQAEAEL